MDTAPQELLKEYVKSQNFASTAKIREAMKEMIHDVIQTAMEVELDEDLWRERCQRVQASEATPNYRNGSFEPKIIGSTAGTRMAWRRKYWPCMPAA